MITLISILTLGFFLGMRHATDADHVVAVTTFVSRERSVRSAALIGMVWGIGHTLTVALVGGAITFFGLIVPERLGMSLEMCVAVMLVILGLINIQSILRFVRGTFVNRAETSVSDESAADSRLRALPERHFGNVGPGQIVRPLIVGIVHGLAGSAALALLVLPMVKNPWWAAAYLLVFGLGTIVGMMVITAAIAWPCTNLVGRFTKLRPRLAGAAGMLSFGFGLFLIYQIGFVQGLFVH